MYVCHSRNCKNIPIIDIQHLSESLVHFDGNVRLCDICCVRTMCRARTVKFVYTNIIWCLQAVRLSGLSEPSDYIRCRLRVWMNPAVKWDTVSIYPDQPARPRVYK